MLVPLEKDDPAAPPGARDPRPRLRTAALVVLMAAVLCFLTLFASWSLTRRRHFSHDSMIYVQVARNWLQGRGLSADILYYPSFRYPARYDFPHPSTQFPPLYPMAIAAVARLGVDPRNAALALPVLALGGVLILGPVLMRRLYDLRTALIALTLLLLLNPLERVSAAAWSEAPALVLWLLSLVVSFRGSGRESGLRRHLVAGILGGLAFATRYAFLVTLPLGIVMAVAGSRGHRRLGGAVVYGAGWMLAGVPVLVRSWTITGYPMGPPRPPSALPLSVNAWGALRALAGQYAAAGHEEAQLAAAGAFGLGLALWLAWKGRAGLAVARELLASRQRFVLPLWTAAYVLFLVGAASEVNLPLFDTRLIVPASLSLTLVAAAVLARVVRIGPPVLCALAVGVALLKSIALGHAIAGSPPVNERRSFRESERLQWVARQATADDLLVGDDAHDLGFHFDRKAVSFDYFNHSARLYPVTGPGLCVMLSWARCEEHRNVYVILRDRVAKDPRWRREPLLTDLVEGRLEGHPQVDLVGRLRDAFVYRWTCGPCPKGAAGPP